jgi:hypothetical protein
MGWDAGDIPDEQVTSADDELLRAERHAALREALAYLPPPCQHLIALPTPRMTQNPGRSSLLVDPCHEIALRVRRVPS